MGLAVVDDQGLALPLGDLDVGAEGAFLGGHALGSGAEVVEPGLADGLDVIEGGQRLDLGEGLVEGRLATARPGALP